MPPSPVVPHPAYSGDASHPGLSLAPGPGTSTPAPNTKYDETTTWRMPTVAPSLEHILIVLKTLLKLHWKSQWFYRKLFWILLSYLQLLDWKMEKYNVELDKIRQNPIWRQGAAWRWQKEVFQAQQWAPYCRVALGGQNTCYYVNRPRGGAEASLPQARHLWRAAGAAG